MTAPRGDELEATQMSDGAAVVHRGKVVSRGMAAAGSRSKRDPEVKRHLAHAGLTSSPFHGPDQVVE